MDPYKLTETEEEQRRGLRQRFIGIFIVISVTHFIINFISSPPPQYIVWGNGTNYFSKVIDFIGQTFQSISFVNIMLSIIVLLFGFFIKRIIYFYTGLLFLVGSFLINRTLSSINTQLLLIRIINSNDMDIGGVGTFKPVITLVYTILCFGFLGIMAYINISYICGYSKYFNEDNDDIRKKRVMYPLISVVIPAIYIYLFQYLGVEQLAKFLYDVFFKLVQEFKSQL
ncbi:hypothetical protein EQ811_11715 [Staphylococcus capitis]|uniref:Uncharacterized protein n=3 Tax=Staphylococcus capitis TaxID=29388 RepID=A0A7Z7YTB1_STACP|nr:hypothetical protein [Staphylococcus capitis]MDS4004856.1 hypothetical protein [Staphylococcus capitis]TBW75371.1 hypothetical protein EQ811_11715 [Staphylococcus capitis]